MSELETLRAAAPQVEPISDAEAARVRARLGRTSRRPAPRLRRTGLLAAPVAVVAALAVAFVALSAESGDSNGAAWGAEAVRMAEASPLLLLRQDGWQVTRVDEWDGEHGEMTFARQGRTFDVRWGPRGDAGGTAAKDGAPTTSAMVLGATAQVARYPGSSEYDASWNDGPLEVQGRGQAPSRAAFVALLQGLHKVDVDTWLRALPASAVAPDQHSDAVDAMLADLPRPPGLDVDALRGGSGTRDRYQVGAQVAGAVACGWIASWVDAKASGDTAAAERAAAALATSGKWKILREMDADGAYPEVLWEYAATVNGAPIPGTTTRADVKAKLAAEVTAKQAGSATNPATVAAAAAGKTGALAASGKPGTSVAATYKAALGCGE